LQYSKHYSIVAMKITMLCSTKTNLNAGNFRILLYRALYDESCYMKTVVTISLVIRIRIVVIRFIQESTVYQIMYNYVIYLIIIT